MQTTKKNGCGCGCSGGCGCKPARLPESAPALCSPCETAAFVRPRFFAGQLLTEDDLQALIEYTVSKQRFHNARLFGEGVVCGLQVQCGPCDSTQIVVEPGYAIDCCGNDLVLTCERTLDLVPMIRELQARLKGRADCTEPCPPAEQVDKKPIEPNRVTTDASNVRHFCLYARYAERPDQPVAAYPVGDDCDAARCEPTRIVEGMTFELRCPPPKSPAKTRYEAMQDCEDLVGKQELTALALAAARFANQPRIDIGDRDVYRELRAIHPTQVEASIASKTPAEQLAVRMQVLATIAPLLARMRQQKVEAGHDLAPLTKYASHVADEIAKTEAAAAPTYLDRVFALKVAESWQTARDPRADLKTPRMQMFLNGVVWDEDVAAASLQHLALTATKLKELGGCFGKLHTDCELRDVIEKLDPKWSPIDVRDYEQAAKQLEETANIVRRFLIDCECAAVLPPCAPCDDPGVLLACFEVDRCKVVRICNMERQFVLAPTTLRYWGLPVPNKAHCCPKPWWTKGNDEPISPWQGPIKRPHELLLAAAQKSAPLYERLSLDLAVNSDRSDTALQDEVADLRRRLEQCEQKLKQKERSK
jgi:hypothetical protein